jgi:hypothetical protein
MSSAPEKIYLQDEDEGLEEYQDVGGRTWCEDKINEGDVEYTRSDLVAKMLQEEREKALEEAAKECERKAIVPSGSCNQDCHDSDAFLIRALKSQPKKGE